MPVISDFSLAKFQDGTLTISMAPPQAIGGWPINFTVEKRYGSSDSLILKSVSSGFNGVSGITVVNSGQGVFNIAINSIDTSGLDWGNYATRSERVNSGARTPITEGFLLLTP